MVRLRWLELDLSLKASIVLGLVLGGGGIIAETSLLVQGPPLFFPGSWPATMAFVTLLLLWPLGSSLSLLFLPLSPQQRDTLYSISVIGSIVAAFVDYYLTIFYSLIPIRT